MSESLWVPKEAGIRFEDGADRVRILVFGKHTGGAYSLMEWIVGAKAGVPAEEPPAFGPHVHRESEETFLVRSGSIEFLLGNDVRTLRTGDFVRVPPGVRHGYANTSGHDADLLVGFLPGGMEELFLKYRTDTEFPLDQAGFIVEAGEQFASEFESGA
ncbi:MAG: cupin domain-containing protein [Dehalococcoidia bacterium]